MLGFPPLLLDLEAVQDTDHVLAVYRLDGHWGAIAKSNFSGLRCRVPVYRTLRELAMSYFEDYINLRGERTLRAYSRPVNLSRFDRLHPGWMAAETDLWWIPDHLVDIPHIPPDAGPGAESLPGGPARPGGRGRRPARALNRARHVSGRQNITLHEGYNERAPSREPVRGRTRSDTHRVAVAIRSSRAPPPAY